MALGYQAIIFTITPKNILLILIKCIFLKNVTKNLPQVVNLQRLLAKAEDDKEASLGNMAHYQHQMENLQKDTKDKTAIKELDNQVNNFSYFFVDLNYQNLNFRKMNKDPVANFLQPEI